MMNFKMSPMCENETLKNVKTEKVLDVTIDNRLNFGMHLVNTAKNSKFNSLTGGKEFPAIEQKKILLLLNLNSLIVL